MLVYPYGIVVDQNGQRFFDEGGGPRARNLGGVRARHPFQPAGSIAYAILDSRLFEIDGYKRAIRSEVPPYQAKTLEDSPAQIGIPARHLRETVKAYNAAATGDPARFDALRCDGLAAASA